jgi:apolipoprotein N-acyltransferase
MRLRPAPHPAVGNGWVAAGLAAASGLIGVTAFPRFGWWPMAIVSIVGLTVAVHGRGVRGGLGLGYLYGWAFFGPLLAWTGTYVGLVWLLLPFAEAAFCAALAVVLARVVRLPGAPAWMACAWVAEEALRDRAPFGGFPWGRWAFSQSASPLRWFAALGGAPLLTFAVALIGSGLATALLAVLTRVAATPDAATPDAATPDAASPVAAAPGRRATRRAAIGGLAVAVAVPLLALAVSVPLHHGRARHVTTIALIQGDVPDRGLEFNARRRQVLDNHVTQTLQLAADVKAGRVSAPELVVWPENASDIDPFDNPDAYAQIERAVHAINRPILVGIIRDGPGPNQDRNMGILWSPTTGPGSQYVKRHPVPFGEYMPFRKLATALTSKATLVQDMVAGKGNGLVTGGPYPIGDVICFEVAYDALVRSSVQAGAQLLVVQTNNATFGHSAETYQQLAMARLRAVEFGRTVVQVSTSGMSAIIDPNGRVVARSGALFTADRIVAQVGLETSDTLATRLSLWPELALSAVAVLAFVATFLAPRPRPAPPSVRETGPPEPRVENEEMVDA